MTIPQPSPRAYPSAFSENVWHFPVGDAILAEDNVMKLAGSRMQFTPPVIAIDISPAENNNKVSISFLHIVLKKLLFHIKYDSVSYVWLPFLSAWEAIWIAVMDDEQALFNVIAGPSRL